MVAVKAAEKHGDDWGLTWYLFWGIYTIIPTWSHSQNSLAPAETLSLKISFHGTSLKWWQRLSQLPQECHKLCSEMGHPLLSLIESQLPEFPNGGKAIFEQILVSQERKKSKRAGLLEPQS